MTSVLKELGRLRKGRVGTVDPENGNRYRILVKEPNGSRTSYYFSAPVYRKSDGKLVKRVFSEEAGRGSFEGSHTTVTLAEKVKLSNDEGTCLLYFPGKLGEISSEHARWGNASLSPTLCGIACRTHSDAPFTFDLEVPERTLDVRANDKCFALMREKFRPFVSVSAIGSLAGEHAVSPLKISYTQKAEGFFRITVSPYIPTKEGMLFEINLYENKLFGDTTVESKNANVNNAFGTTAFLGTTPFFGDMWLYSRPDLGKMPEIHTERIQSAKLYLPLLGDTAAPLRAVGITARFCSFGTTWNNKMSEVPVFTESREENGYLVLDVTSFFTDEVTHLPRLSNGFILRTKEKAMSAVIPTADSSLYPQILEIKTN